MIIIRFCMSDGKTTNVSKGYAEIAPEIIRELKRLHHKPKGGKWTTAAKIAETMNAGGWTTADGKAFTGNNVAMILYRHK